MTLYDFVAMVDQNEIKAKQQVLGECIMFIVILSCKYDFKNAWFSGIQRQQLAKKMGLEAVLIV